MTNSNDSLLLALEDEFFDQYNAGHFANTEALAVNKHRSGTPTQMSAML
jgi:hypothetical protein